MANIWESFVDETFVAELREFVRTTVAPEADRIDREDIYPIEIAKALAKRGWTTLTLSADYKGGGAKYQMAAALFEEVAVGSAAVAISIMSTFQAQTIIARFGSESLRSRYLPLFREGLLCAYALTEASHGSDIRHLDTKARSDKDGWVINGEKSFITSGSAAEFFIILAETPAGVSAFAVPKDVKGLSTYVGDASATMGLRNGPHVNLVLDNVRVAADHLIGIEGKGVRQVVTTLDYSRTLAAAVSVGIARAAFDEAMTYAKKRAAFGQNVFEFQGIQWYFAEMLAEIDAARHLVYRAAEALNSHTDIERYSSEAKLKATSVAAKMTSIAVQVCGAYGTANNSPFGRYFRDAKTYEIAGGSAEILKNTIAKYLVKHGN
jgi:alkylation response protein AidB-like acyl-CoA dehydrogenase